MQKGLGIQLSDHDKTEREGGEKKGREEKGWKGKEKEACLE